MTQPSQDAAAPAQTQQQIPQVPLLPSPAPNYIKGRPVVSIDEARASQIDLDGSLYVFPDLGNKKIYTKQINMDGTAAFNVFELVAAGQETPPETYVTKEELDTILEQFKASLATSTPAKTKPSAPPINF